jgi:hypothetical protein
MTAGIYDFTLEQGATFSRTLTYKIDDVAVNLTGYTARMKAKRRFDDVSPLINLTTENGGITLGGSAGTITLTMSATDTAALSFDTAFYDLELVSGGGVVTRLVRGTIALSKEATA